MAHPAPGRRWRVLLVHNRYQQRGGEDVVVDAEAELLQRHGHAVERYERHNDEIEQLPAARVALGSWWSTRTRRDLREVAARFRPELIHVHNSFPLISPSVFAAARELDVPVLQTLHNFRLLCPQAMLLRDGRPCEDCVGRVPWRAVQHRCYRGSAAQSATLATMLQLHRLLGTWQRAVTLYVALSEHGLETFVRGGLPRERLRVKPNFVDLPPPPDGPRSGCLFVGRLAAEKGLDVLAAAAALRPEAAPIRVLGDGPELARLRGLPGLQLLGAQPPAEVQRQMQSAAVLLIPSLWAEAFPRVLVEAFACGLPVIASRIGALAELVSEGRTGLLFEPGDASALAAQVAWAEAHPLAMREMGHAAHQHQQAHWTGEANHRQLTALYAEALALHGNARR